MSLYDRESLEQAVVLALEAWRPKPDITSLEWAEKHFKLSRGVDYSAGPWRCWPFQRAILLAMGDDRISEVSFQKSARLGWSAMVRAIVGYFIEHKKRGLAVWSPTDSDRDRFSKKAIDALIRDCPAVANVMPNAVSRHKDNTLELKQFVGATLHLLGGKAGKNYRDISISVGVLEEVEAFDKNIDGEGSPYELAWKRFEGATFGKGISGSTPRGKEGSLIETRCAAADVRYRYQIPCPECGEFHELTWLVDDDPAQQTHGLRWVAGEPNTVRHLCPHCGCLIDQGRYLDAAPNGRWMGSDGSTIDQDGVYRDSDGAEIDPPEHVAFHCWSAYSPSVSWPRIIRAYERAMAKLAEGDDAEYVAFVNTTLGQTYAGQVDSISEGDLDSRVRPFPLRIVPRDCLVLLAGVDTQDNRLEAGVWGFGRGSQTWTVDHQVFHGDPGREKVWGELWGWFIGATYPHAAGSELMISMMGLDTGGHYTQAAYEFARQHRSANVYALKGRGKGLERAIKDSASPVETDWRGKKRPRGVILWQVGTNMAKDLLFSRLAVPDPGPGYVNISHETTPEWRKQFVGEVRRTMPNGESRWMPTRKRVEALDCAVYAMWCEEHMDLKRKPESWWADLEARVQPEPVRNPDPVPPPPEIVKAGGRVRIKLGGARFAAAGG